VFGAGPTVRKADYAKWMVEDPRLNFAISHRGNAPGVNHLGLQVDSDEELGTLRAGLAAAGLPIADERNVSCCYARGNKHWTVDPDGIAWESFHTLDEVPTFGAAPSPEGASARCGSSATQSAKACCE
jgi:hypothetical protein